MPRVEQFSTAPIERSKPIIAFEKEGFILNFYSPPRQPHLQAPFFRQYSIDLVAAWLKINFSDRTSLNPLTPHALIQDAILDLWPSVLMPHFAPSSRSGHLNSHGAPEVMLKGSRGRRTSDVIVTDSTGVFHLFEISRNHKDDKVRQQSMILTEIFPLLPIQGWTGAWQMSTSGVIEVHFKPQYSLGKTP
jgi:hypothetical protein